MRDEMKFRDFDAQGGDQFRHEAGPVFQGNPEYVDLEIEIGEYDPVLITSQYAPHQQRHAFLLVWRAAIETRREHHEVVIGAAGGVASGYPPPEWRAAFPLPRITGQ